VQTGHREKLISCTSRIHRRGSGDHELPVSRLPDRQEGKGSGLHVHDRRGGPHRRRGVCLALQSVFHIALKYSKERMIYGNRCMTCSRFNLCWAIWRRGSSARSF